MIYIAVGIVIAGIIIGLAIEEFGMNIAKAICAIHGIKCIVKRKNNF